MIMRQLTASLVLLGCLVSALHGPIPPLRIIKLEGETREMNDEQIQGLIRDRVKFMDITFGGELSATAFRPPAKIPADLSRVRERLIRGHFGRIDQARMKRHLVKLTSFRTRYYQSGSGREAAEWIYRMAKHLTKGSPMRVVVKRMIHPNWPQFSVVCRLEPPTGSYAAHGDRVVLSAHLDSTASWAPAWNPAPGADDDGSGVVTQLEALHLLSQAALPLGRPIEFIFYAAEEAGLLGSQSIVRHYQARRIPATVLHIDMDGYVKPGSTPGIGLITDNTNRALNQLLRQLVQKYTSLPVKETQCGYACSDHYSWHSAGYPAAALFEGLFEEMSPKIHSGEDRVETINFGHMEQFVRIALAFALHLTDPDVEYRMETET